MGNPIWFSYLALAQAIRKDGSSMKFLMIRENAIKEEFDMRKQLDYLGWKIGSELILGYHLGNERFFNNR